MHPMIEKHIVDGFIAADLLADPANEVYRRAIAQVKMVCSLAKATNDYTNAANAVVAFYNRFW